jgi:putative transposase
MATESRFPQRRSNRWRGHDYGRAGAYFVTACVQGRVPLFGEVVGAAMQRNEMGNIVLASWNEIPGHFRAVDVDECIVMPDHVHGIVILRMEDAPDAGRARHASPLRELGAVVASFKSASSRRIHELRDTPGGPVWQRGYFDRVLRDDAELVNARRYIADNPLRWSIKHAAPSSSSPSP